VLENLKPLIRWVNIENPPVGILIRKSNSIKKLILEQQSPVSSTDENVNPERIRRQQRSVIAGKLAS
jgi:hypothetical protein